MKKHKTQKILLIVASSFIILSGFIYLTKQFGNLKLDKQIGSFKKVTFLMHATGENDQYFFSVLVSLYPKEKKAGLFFINPLSNFDGGDSTLEAEGKSAVGIVESNLSKILGFKPNFTIKINSSQFKKIINLSGGIPFYFEPKTLVQSNIYNRPNSGSYLLDGEDALDYLTSIPSKNPMDYVSRLERQESAILSFYFNTRGQVLDIKKLWINYLYSLMETNLEENEWSSLVDFLLSEEIHFGISELPGELNAINKTDLFILRIKKDTVKIAYNKFEADLLSEFFADSERTRTEVLNGTAINGLAKKAKSLLAENRIKVLSVENAWTINIKESVVLDRSGNSKVSSKISTTLNHMPRFFVVRKELGLDSTVVLGEEFDKAK
jgi:anionic cell wall polymer biosynthesis LytR-Cps2A-Psr (LCP) family protein